MSGPKRKLKRQTAEVFEPLLKPNRYRAAHGGRGSGKSHFFAEQMIFDSLEEPGLYGEGLRCVCIREVQKSLKDSAKRLLEDKIIKFGLTEADGFKIYKELIQTPKDGVIIFQGMADQTADSIKSLEGYKRAWCEESQTLSSRSIVLLRPTIRADNSELWFSWNPRRKVDPIDMILRNGNAPTGAAIVQANWQDNPWFPDVLNQERLDCMRDTPDQYDHIWEGGYATVVEGAYWAQQLLQAKQEGRISHVPEDQLMTFRAHWDIGGTGAKADNVAIWIEQTIGQTINIVNHYESQGQPLATHVNWLRENGYKNALCFLPHDGVTHDRVYDVSYESALNEAGFETEVVANQGRGAAKMRVEAARRVFPKCWFNEKTTESGIQALGWYHERIDEARTIGLGPEHDWSSHSADAFGLMAIVHELPDERGAVFDQPDQEWVL